MTLLSRAVLSYAGETDGQANEEAVSNAAVPSIAFWYEEYPPYSYSQDGQATGKNVVIANMVASAAGVRI
ncbi:hypothetical protein GCM10017044_18480 [Kordiimonas sediminis]|uniref:Uncharacterized protein n=1 Tax=Kordiimonas sediminis TaxID=1735581 RepID=A0A919ASF0_9PROT|nr:hypothetical protein [Kordiimonas sediminis]GHF24167.1 hypothetical protein GCM10017044_18480 [Kordiimonas sediminis]